MSVFVEAIPRAAARSRCIDALRGAALRRGGLAKPGCKSLKRLDPEKEMKENERTIAASRAFHERERASGRGLANSAACPLTWPLQKPDSWR